MDRQTLILTNSRDLTVDRLIHRIGTDRVFRFNLDIWEDYQVHIRPGDFELSNPTGRTIRRAQVAKCLWRKPMMKSQLHWKPGIPQDTFYLELEMEKAVKEIRNLLRHDGKLVMIEPASDDWLGKLLQMDIAARYFTVPRYEFTYPPAADGMNDGTVAIKSLSGERVKAGHYLWTTQVQAADLDPKIPWFKQALVNATHDVTVAYLRGRCFAYAFAREHLAGKTIDWREAGKETIPHWQAHALPADIEQGIRNFMSDVDLQYGRLDFLYDGNTHHFLEVNANGEWDWLDPDKGRGLFEAIIEEVHPDTPVHPI